MIKLLLLSLARPLAAQIACAPGGPAAVFVVASGRSGSTSLMRLLRDMPRSDFLGENGGVLSRLVDFDNFLRDSRQEMETLGGDMRHSPWVYNPAPPRETTLAAYRELLYNVFGWRKGPGVSLIGFKEVRWKKTTPATPRTDVDLLLEVFPCARFVLNYRNDTQAQLRSGFWDTTERPRESTKTLLESVYEEIFGLRTRLPASTFLISTEELKSPSKLQALLEWVDPAGRACGCRVLQPPHENANSSLRSSADACTRGGGCVHNNTGLHLACD